MRRFLNWISDKTGIYFETPDAYQIAFNYTQDRLTSIKVSLFYQKMQVDITLGGSLFLIHFSDATMTVAPVVYESSVTDEDIQFADFILKECDKRG